jgi:hypothetical protein
MSCLLQSKRSTPQGKRVMTLLLPKGQHVQCSAKNAITLCDGLHPPKLSQQLRRASNTPLNVHCAILILLDYAWLLWHCACMFCDFVTWDLDCIHPQIPQQLRHAPSSTVRDNFAF